MDREHDPVKIIGDYGVNNKHPIDVCINCPICGENYVHMGDIIKSLNDDHYRYVGHIRIEGNTVITNEHTETSDYRGERISLYFKGECGHEFSLRFHFHKGNTYLRAVNETIIEEKLQLTAKEQYLEYLKSDKWKKKAARKRQQAGNRCQLCNRGDLTLHIHHRTYDNVYHEKSNDLICLCERCHKLYHGKEKSQKNG